VGGFYGINITDGVSEVEDCVECAFEEGVFDFLIECEGVFGGPCFRGVPSGSIIEFGDGF